MADIPPLALYPLVRSLKDLLYGVADETMMVATPCPGWSVGDLLDHLTSLTWTFTRAARKAPGPQSVLTPDRPTPDLLTPDRYGYPGAFVPGTPPPSAANLHPQWRSRLPSRLDELADSWADPAAWTGTAQAGGVTFPAERMGLLAATEFTVHGWDLARATGQNFAVDPRVLEILVGFLSERPDPTDQPDPTDRSDATERPDATGQPDPPVRRLIPEQRTPQRHRPDDRGGAGPLRRVVEIEDAAPLLDRVIVLSGRDPDWHP